MVDVLSSLIQLGSAVPLASDWHDDGPGWWIVFPILFWTLVIVGTVLLVRTMRRSSAHTADAARESAIEVLDRRFANGEISLEEYRERRAVLAEQQSDG